MQYEVVSKNEIRLFIHALSFFITEKEIRDLIKVLTNALFDMNNFKGKEVP